MRYLVAATLSFYDIEFLADMLGLRTTNSTTMLPHVTFVAPGAAKLAIRDAGLAFVDPARFNAVDAAAAQLIALASNQEKSWRWK